MLTDIINPLDEKGDAYISDTYRISGCGRYVPKYSSEEKFGGGE